LPLFGGGNVRFFGFGGFTFFLGGFFGIRAYLHCGGFHHALKKRKGQQLFGPGKSKQ
jgi:hypothetical protein